MSEEDYLCIKPIVTDADFDVEPKKSCYCTIV